jgi:hypothetical protein
MDYVTGVERNIHLVINATSQQQDTQLLNWQPCLHIPVMGEDYLCDVPPLNKDVRS